MDLTAYRESARDRARCESLMRLIPNGQTTALDVGARDGHLSRALAGHFERVIALDVNKPSFSFERVTPVAGDVTNLAFDDASVDCVLCAEVLEHIPPASLEKACSEIARVARVAAVIGVPFRQDLRFGRTRCLSCGTVNPPWGHENAFDESRLTTLFAPMRAASVELVWLEVGERTNWLSARLMEWAGFPWGTYNQDEPCRGCGHSLVRPRNSSVSKRLCARFGLFLEALQRRFSPARPLWLHVRFEKR